MRVIMLGPPGAGKGTQGERIASRYAVPHISSGEIFRDEVARQTPLGVQLRGYLDAGDLVPDDLVLSMIMDRVIKASENDGGYVLDGFPRSLGQAEEAYRVATQVSGVELQSVVHLIVPRKELLRRMRARAAQEGRTDDNEATVEHRLDVYDSETEPMLGFYAGRGLVVDVDGYQPVEAVFDDTVKAVDALRPGLR